MKNTFRIYPLILIAIFTINCNRQNSCFESYQVETKTNRPSHLSTFSHRLYINIDSTLDSKNGCQYIASSFIPLGNSTISYKSLIFYSNEKIFMRLIDKKTNTFVLFDFKSKINKPHEINIEYRNQVFKYNCTLQEKVFTKEYIEVFVFKIEDLFNFYEDGEFIKSEDVMFFATIEYGIVGSYISGIEKDGQKIMIAPAGEILSDYIDYSNVELRLIQ